MRPRSIRNPRSANHDHVNVTPMIDVVMCLIVFYLIVGKLAQARLAEVDLPHAAHGLHTPHASTLIINVLAPDDPQPAQPRANAEPSWSRVRVVVDALPVNSAAQLEALIRARLLSDTDAVVQVRASRRLSFGDVRPVLGSCAAAGAQRVQLVARPGGAGGAGGAGGDG